MEEILYRYNPWWEEKYELPGLFSREAILGELKKSLSNNQIVILTGLRRVGKTSLIRLFIKYLIDKEKIAPSHIFYVSLDDYLLAKKNILEIIEAYRQLHKIRFQEKVYLFFDEVTYQKDFELQLKNIYDQQNAKIFATSSSASVLKSKKPFLTGRNIIYEILPLDFEEYLKFKEVSVKKRDQRLLEKYFEEYLKSGGMPEFVLTGDTSYLKELIDDIISKDIVAFNNLKDPQVLKDFFVLLMERAGKIVSINKIANIMGIAPDTAKRYLKMFEDAYLIYLVSRAGKTNEKLLSPKKIYASDLGFRNLFTGFRDKGSLFENYVFLKIKNFKPGYIYEKTNEIDFFTEDKRLIEVKYNSDLTPDQKKLFDKTKAAKKIIIKSVFDLDKLRSQ